MTEAREADAAGLAVVPSPGTPHAQPFDRLRDRAAFRFTAYWGGASFVLLQTSDALVPALGLPDVVNTVVAYAFMGGFPIAVTVGWVFDLIMVRRVDTAALSSPHVVPGHGSSEEASSAAGRAVSSEPTSDDERRNGVHPIESTRGGHAGPTLVFGMVSTTVAVSIALAVLGWSRLGFETYLALWATVAGGVWFLFDKAEQSVTDAVREDTVRWLGSGSTRKAVDGLPRVFQVMFDKVFGERHLSWTCFYRSCFASLLAVTFVLAAWLITRPEARMLAGEPAFIRSLLWLVFLTGLLNFIPDYLSLLETRLLLKHTAGRWKTRTILLADAVFTAGISFVVIRVSLGLVYGFGTPYWFSFGEPMHQFLDMITFSEDFGHFSMAIVAEREGVHGQVPVPVGVFFWSAFVTSAWLWIFGLATLAMRLIAALGKPLEPLVRAFGYESTPFRAVGYAAVIVITAIFLLGLPIVVV